MASKYEVVEQIVREKIRTYKDWPKEGINFIDASLVYADAGALQAACRLLEWTGVEAFRDSDVDAKYLLVPEARGLLLGSAIALGGDMGLVLVRKPGKVPGPIYDVKYELEYGEDGLEIPQEAIPPGSSVLIHDDLLATGGTAAATARLATAAGAKVEGFIFLMELSFLNGRQVLEHEFDVPVGSALTFSE